MFRQVFMTFHGEYRGEVHGGHHGDAHGHHGEADHPHESPPTMTIPLIILAAAAILASGLGVTALFRQLPGMSALFNEHYFSRFLEPVFANGVPAVPEQLPQWGGIETVLMIVTLSVVAASFFLSYQMYYKKSLSPQVFANLAGGALYRAVYNKYYVDEFYQVVFVNGTLLLSRALAWFDANVIDGIVNGAATVTRATSWLSGQFDHYVVDGLVNGAAWATAGIGNRVRRIQTGNINWYVYGIVFSLVVIVGVRFLAK